MSIVTKKKDFKKILTKLKDSKGVLIIGCEGCAKDSHTGGPSEVKEMEVNLEEVDIPVFILHDPCFYYTCWEKTVEERFDEISALSEKIDTILLLACGTAVSCLNVVFDRHDLHVKIIPGTDTLGIGHVPISGPEEVTCWSCGECVLVHNACKLKNYKKNEGKGKKEK
jgi:hypothetical protein